MKILFVTDNFPPEVNAPASRTYEHCKRWVDQGAEVTLITCAPNFPQGRVYEGYKNKLYQTEMVDGIKVIRVWSYISANEGFLKRVLDYVSFAFMAFWAGLFKKCDLIVITSPQFFTTLTGYFLSLFKRKKWVFELRDLWPESIVTVGAMKKSRAIRMLEKIEHFMYRKADLIIPVTNAFKDTLVKRGIDENKMVVVTNGVNASQFKAKPKPQELVAKYGLDGKFVIGYIGTHGMAHSLDFIMNAIVKLTDPNIHFLFVGSGAEKQKIVNIAQEHTLTNVTFVDPVSKDLVVDYVALTDAALVPLRKSDTFKTVIPSKIFENAAMQKPILLGVEGQAKDIVDTHKAGLCFEPENETSFLEAVQKLSKDKALYKDLQTGCTELATAYDRNNLADTMLIQLKKLI